MNNPSGTNLSRLAFVVLIGGSLAYSFIFSRLLTPEMRELVDSSLKYGFYVGYSLWVLGIVLTNAAATGRIVRRNFAGNRGIGAVFQIWNHTLTGTFKASIISPITARRVLGAYEGYLQKMISVAEIYLLRPLISLIWLVGYAIISAMLMLLMTLIRKLFAGKPEKEKSENGLLIMPIACVTGTDGTRKLLLKALTSAMANVTCPPWLQYDTPRINTASGLPKYNYGEVLLSRKKNSKLPSHSLRICDFEGSDTVSINMLDAMPFYARLKGCIIVVEELVSPDAIALAFDKWYELMFTSYKSRLNKLKCAVVIRPNEKQRVHDGACELYAGADKNTCLRFLREHQQMDILQKTTLFRNSEFFAVSANGQDLNECPGVHALAKWLLKKAI